MSTFAVKVHEIKNPVEDHPNADRLSIIRIDGYLTISNKLEDGSHRYKVGDLVVYVPEAALVPEFLLRKGFWNEDKNQGILAGTHGNRVKPMRLRGVYSQGILFPVVDGKIFDAEDVALEVTHGQDVTEFLGITKYEPPIPTQMSGELTSVFGHTYRYDIDSIQSMEDIFEEHEMVVVTEKIHGTHIQIGYAPDLEHDEMFYNGKVFVTSKGVGGQGLAFKNNEKNVHNVYVMALKQLLENGLGEALERVSKAHGDAPVHLFGEVFGKGIQDLHYGLEKKEVAFFDVRINNKFVMKSEELFTLLNVAVVPVLFSGRFNKDEMEKLRDGKTTLGDSHIREGIVITSAFENYHPLHGRKIAKWVSPDYALRKGGTEFN